MNHDETTQKESTERLPYEPPAIEESGEFETLALACGRRPADGLPACIGNPTNS